MKRVIDGKTYNTATSARAARWDYTDDRQNEVEATLYQTRGGAFFVVHVWEVRDFDGDRREKSYAEAMTFDEVRRLVSGANDLEILDSRALEEPPEAVEEEEAGATLYLRLPASLKARVDAAAEAGRVSANAWAMRCLESCLAAKKAQERELSATEASGL